MTSKTTKVSLPDGIYIDEAEQKARWHALKPAYKESLDAAKR